MVMAQAQGQLYSNHVNIGCASKHRATQGAAQEACHHHNHCHLGSGRASCSEPSAAKNATTLSRQLHSCKQCASLATSSARPMSHCLVGDTPFQIVGRGLGGPVEVLYGFTKTSIHYLEKVGRPPYHTAWPGSCYRVGSTKPPSRRHQVGAIQIWWDQRLCLTSACYDLPPAPKHMAAEGIQQG